MTDSELDRLRAENARLREALQSLLNWGERQICSHDTTHRGGTNWEICDACGMKWADDEGGKPEFSEPLAIDRAHAALQGAKDD